MEPRTIKRILDALREEFRAAGLPEPEEAVKIARNALTEDENALASSIVVGAWEEFHKILRQEPEPTSEALNEKLTEIKDLRYQFRDELLAAGKKSPHRPGGAPQKLTAKQREKACELVGYFMGQGDKYPQAVQKVARRFNVSPKTIEREWQKLHRKKDSQSQNSDRT